MFSSDFILINSWRPPRKIAIAKMRRPKMRVPMIMTQVLTTLPVPMNMKLTSDSYSLKSTPFMATVTKTVSSAISDGSSAIFGVKHRIVVVLM